MGIKDKIVVSNVIMVFVLNKEIVNKMKYLIKIQM